MWTKFWNDEAGAIISGELALVMTVSVLAMTAGLSSLRDGVVGELGDVGQAIGDFDQSYAIGGVRSPSASLSGMTYIDDRDFGDNTTVAGQNSRGLVVATPQLPVSMDNSYANRGGDNAIGGFVPVGGR